ncbi:ATP-dependent Clp protease ATP-binding subunit ClpA [bacterium]|nr:ATP-dependent Clp protease ATP-binding subunit ClpA [bacterium]
MITEELEKTLNRAYQDAKLRSHEYITLEHLLLSLTYDKTAAQILYHCGASLSELQADVDIFLKEQMPKITDPNRVVDPQYTIGVQFVLQTAAAQIQSSGKGTMDGGDVLVALFREKESHAVYFLEKRHIHRFDVVRYIAHQISKKETFPPKALTELHGDEESMHKGKDPLTKYCVNLNEHAKKGKIDPLIGRDDELERTVHILARRKKNNPIFVGDAGVGKTAITEGLALKIVKGDVPPILKESTIYKLDMARLLAGTKFRGEFEERLKEVVEQIQDDPKKILFIDEIHTIIGAGAVSGGSMDASNLLKPALASGDIKCIGTTTYKEYRQIFEKDHALSRRFQKVEVKEPSHEDTIKILFGLKKKYEDFHGVQYSPSVIRSIVELSTQYIHDHHLPDKAIDVMDEAGAEVKLRSKKEKNPRVHVADAERVVSRMARVPAKTVKVDDKKKLKDLSRDLKLLIYGQDEAVDKVVSSIQLSRSGLAEPDKPIGCFLFAGPTGVGKTETAKQLAKSLGVEFVRFDMSEYMEKHTVSRLIGSPPGYVGYEEGGQLTEAITRNPHCVLLLDEIEKAHPDLFNILLQVMDHATLTDNNGRKANFRQVILIMSSNVGARDSMIATIGFEKDMFEDKSDKAIEKAFSPEFRNRLTGVVKFHSLDPRVIEQIVEKMMAELENRLKSKNVTVQLDAGARQYLAEKGFDKKFGARPIKRLIENEVAKVLSDEILFGKLEHGGLVTIKEKNGKLSFHFESNSPVEKKKKKELQTV